MENGRIIKCKYCGNSEVKVKVCKTDGSYSLFIKGGCCYGNQFGNTDVYCIECSSKLANNNFMFAKIKTNKINHMQFTDINQITNEK